ncbi:MAG: hypothetical protein HWE16_04325 [Gammaproteobacteria bacterium]|nr:hypothetical protein [Gammaproteobacteria bacterium]
MELLLAFNAYLFNYNKFLLSMNFKRLLIIIICILFLQSCGLKFWYNRLDWVVSWKADDFVELTSEQEDKLEAAVRDKLAWHRSTQLPRYISLITELEADLGSDKIAQKYDYYQKSFMDFYQTVVKEVTPELLNLVADLDNKQTQELMKNLNDNANKRLQEFNKLSSEKRLKEVNESIIDGFEEWAGKLTKGQKTMIAQWVDEMLPTAELRFEYGNQWRVAMDYALANRANPEGKATIENLILNPRNLQNAELKSRIESNKNIEKQYILQLHANMTAKQKKRFLRKLESYREDFQDLLDD